ncbi:MAG: hypothetical protein RIA09_15805 [Hoeflea sp.]|jgi:hypothetical protein|uniref:hypothetical protein n=1 Tax=Hoeflea sp. TaxID=1940281 RepID=UPI0032ED6329
MSIKASAVRFPIDAENIIRAETEGALTAAGNTAGRDLGLLSAYWNEGDLAMPEQVAFVLFVTDLDTDDGDEEYTVEVQVASDDAFSDAVSVLSAEITSTGNKTILVSRDQVLDALDGAGHIRLRVTPAGTTPSITFWAILSPIVGR